MRVKSHFQRLKTSSFISQNLNKGLSRKVTKINLLDKNISTVEKLDRNEMLKEKVRENPKQTCITQTLTYNRFFPDISKAIRKILELTSNK